ncbi:MAG: bifunctional serine/threonine-protein kinase/formylglycine-generating enzyme family protein [Bauldia litoralis]
MTKDPRQPLPVGARIASYRIDGVLGAGGAAVTYAATNKVVHRRVAIKEYLPIGLARRDEDGVAVSPVPGRIQEFAKGLDLFVGEAKVLASFRYPAVAPIEHYIQANGTAYVVMPYIEGETLAARLLDRGRLTHAEVETLLPPLLDALAAVHEAGLVHGDLKPANIILQSDGGDPFGHPVLIDFGSARQVGDAAHAHGSPGYAAPEAYRRRAKATAAGDVYALGAVLCRALTGRPPAAAPDRIDGADTPSVTQTGLREARLPLLDAVDRALALDPSRRPASIADFQALLARAPGDIVRLRPRPRTGRAAWAGVAATLVLALALVIATTTHVSRESTERPQVPPAAVLPIPAPATGPVRFADCAGCPRMETVPGTRTAIAIAPVSQRAFAAFVAATGHSLPGGCVRGDGVGGWRRDVTMTWRGAGDPVVCVSWRDAQAFAAWLRARTGKAYRLPTAGELAARTAGSRPGGPRQQPIAQRLDRIAPGAGRNTPADAAIRSEWTADCWAQDAGASLYCPTRMVVNWRDSKGGRIRTGLPAGLRHIQVGFRVAIGPRAAGD